MGNIVSAVVNWVKNIFMIGNPIDLSDQSGYEDNPASRNQINNQIQSSTGGSDSNQPGSKEEPGEVSVSYTLMDLTLSEDLRATCQVKLPSDEMVHSDGSVVVDPLAVLLIRDINSSRCISIMRQCTHQNILQAILVVEKKGYSSSDEKKEKEISYAEVWVEDFTGELPEFIQSCISAVLPKELVLGTKPSLSLPGIQYSLSQIIDGLLHLKLIGKYHGNFTFKNTLYKRLGTDIEVKLTNFKLKDRTKSFQLCVVEDFHAVGNELLGISQAPWISEKFDCFEINDLARKLKDLTTVTLPSIEQEILEHPFFWEKNDRKFFFISDIPFAMKSKTWRNKIEEHYEDICGSLPWGSDGYDGYLQQMDDYRTNHNLDAYNKDSAIDFVKFLSGLYVHEAELQGPGVDETVKLKNRHIFLTLHNLTPRTRLSATQ